MSRTIIDPSLIPSAALNTVNILDNPGFENWQRGASFTTPANQAYCPDRWNVIYSGTPTFTISKETSLIDTGLAAAKVNVTVAGTGALYLKQLVENFSEYLGKTVTATIRVKCSVASKIRMRINDSITEDFGAYHSGSGNYETLSVTHVVSSSATSLNIAVGVIGGSDVATVMTWYADSAMCVTGTQALAYVPTNPQVDLARCQRFFYSTAGGVSSYILSGQCVSSVTVDYIFRFPVPMRTAPTITVNNPTHFSTWNSTGTPTTLTNLANAGGLASRDEMVIEATVASGMTAGNASLLLSSNADATIFFSADL